MNLNIFRNMIGVPKEQRTQLFLRDYGKLQFRKMRIKDTFMVIMKGAEVVKGWKHFYKLQFPFPGYRHIKPDMVTLAFDRDIILDPFGIMKDGDKPTKNVPINQNKWISDVAEAARYRHQSHPAKAFMTDRLMLFLGSATIINVLIAGLLWWKGAQ